jgi:4-hydroxybenzoate polyprenyltransferase
LRKLFRNASLPSTPRAVVGLVRPFTLLAPPVGTVAGAFVAMGATGAPWNGWRVLFAVLSGLLATGASNAWNQAFDAPLDRVNKPGRPVPRGDVTVKEAMVFGHVLALLALVLGALASPGFLVCVLLGITATWIYSAPPLRTKRSPLGALATIAFARGLLVPVAGWSILADPLQQEPWLLGAISALFVFGAAATKDFADMEGDRAYGCRTLPIVLGPKRAARCIAPALVFPPLGYVTLGALGLLSAPIGNLAALSAVLMLGGLATAWALLRAPDALAEGSGNHPAWAGMYLLLLGQHIGAAIAYTV